MSYNLKQVHKSTSKAKSIGVGGEFFSFVKLRKRLTPHLIYLKIIFYVSKVFFLFFFLFFYDDFNDANCQGQKHCKNNLVRISNYIFDIYVGDKNYELVFG